MLYMHINPRRNLLIRTCTWLLVNILLKFVVVYFSSSSSSFFFFLFYFYFFLEFFFEMFRLVPLAFEYTSQKFQEKRSKYLYVNIFSNGKRKILRSFDNFLRLQRHDRYGEYVLHRCFHGSFIYLFFLLINQNERKVRGYDLTSLSPYRCKYFSTKLTIPRFYDLQTTLVV